MRIEFDPTNPTEAAAVRAMLTAIAPASGGDITTPETHQPEQTTRLVIRADQFVVTNGTEEKPVLVSEDGVVLPQADSNGEPHDPRIHSTPPKLNADGTWRAKRGVTAEQIAAVRAEREAQTHDANLTASDAELIEQAQPLELPTEAPPVPLAEPAESAPATPPASPANEPSSTPTPAPTPPAPTVDAGTSVPSFLDVMKAITAAQKDGKIDTAKVKELCAAVGAGESTMGLNGPDNGDKRGAFMALLASETEGK